MKQNPKQPGIALSQSDIEFAVENLLKRQKPDIDILNEYITHTTCEKAITLYSHALQTRQANQQTHKAMCEALLHHGQLNRTTVEAMVNKVKKNNLVTREFYSVLLNTLYSNDYFCSELTLSLFESAQNDNCLELSIFNNTLFIIARADNPNPSDAWDIFLLACDTSMCNEKTFNSMINVIANSTHPDLQRATDVLELAERFNLVTIETYCSLLKVIYHIPSPPIEQALYFFGRAKQLDEKDPEARSRVYNSMLTVLSNVKSKETSALAIKIFDEAKAKGIANRFIYTSTIYALDPERDIHFITDLFEQSKENQLESIGIYHAILDAFAKNKGNYSLQAQFLISREIEQRLISFPKIVNGEVDLHGFSYGETYFWLKKQLPVWHRDPNIQQVTLICGKGLHTRRKNIKHKDEGTHAVKQGVLDALAALSPPNDYSCQDNPRIGQIDVMFKNKKACLLDCRSREPSSNPHYAPPADYKGPWAGLFQSADHSIADSPISVPKANLVQSVKQPSVKLKAVVANPTPYNGTYLGLFKTPTQTAKAPVLPTCQVAVPTTRKGIAAHGTQSSATQFKQDNTAAASFLNPPQSLQTPQSSDQVKPTQSSSLNPEAKPYTPSWHLR